MTFASLVHKDDIFAKFLGRFPGEASLCQSTVTFMRGGERERVGLLSVLFIQMSQENPKVSH